MIVLAILLAQFAHRSNPGAPSSAAATITSNGQCQVVSSGGTNSAMFAVTGTWTGTLGFFGTNDLGVTTVALQGYAVNPATGALNTSSVNTTTGNGVWIADTFGMYSTEICATAAMTGTALVRIDADPASAVVQVTGPGGGPVPVSGSLSVSGAADVVSTGAPTTFNANTICTGALLTAGLQSAGFHFDVGTLIGTFTAQCSAFTSGTTNFTNGGLKDVTGATVSGAVTNPNAQTDWTITCPGDTRRVQVCTTAFTSGSTTGQAVGTFYQTASAAAGGGGGVVTQATGTNLHTVTDATSVTAATQSGTWTVQPGNTANTTAWKVDGSAVTQPVSGTVTTTPPSNASTNLAQVAGATTATGHGTAAGTIRVELPTDGTGQVAIANTVTVQGPGSVGAGSGGWLNAQGDPSMTPFQVANKTTAPLFANAAATFASAATLSTACTTTTGCLNTAAIKWNNQGAQSSTLTIVSVASPVGFTLACDPSYDGGTTFVLAGCDFWQPGVYRKGSLTNADLTGVTQWNIYYPLGAPSFAQVRVSVVTSGSISVAGDSAFAPSMPFPVEAKTPTQATVTLTASTSETTLMAAGGSGVFLDLTYLKCSNTSATASAISIRDATAGTVRDTLVCPAAIGPCEGNVYRVPFRQTTSNANWTIQAGTSASSLVCTAQAVQR